MLLILAASSAEADPAAIDLPTLIECRSDLAAYTAFAAWMTEGEPKLGWRRVQASNPLLLEYRLPAPVRVFGRDTDRVAFASSALLAVLDQADPTSLSVALDVPNMLRGDAKFLGERVVNEVVEEDEGTRYATRTAISVSTVDTHPGKTLAGCSYRVDVTDVPD